jgi:archaellum component FlaC
MAARQGQLDQISQAIGQLEGRFDGIERYMHDREHGLNNLSQKVDGLSSKFSSDIASAKGEISATLSTAVERMEARIQTIDDRVGALETIKEQEKGAKTALAWLLQSPLIGWLVAAALFLTEWWKGAPR